MPRRLAALFCLVLLAGCAGGLRYTSDTDGAAAAWERAYVILPGEQEPRRLGEAGEALARHAGARLPVVLFAHACAGFDAEAGELFRQLAARGFAAVAPDHLARADARRACAWQPARPLPAVRRARHDGTYAPPVAALLPAGPDTGYAARRLAEVVHALDRLRAEPWADVSDIHLVGHSLGRGTLGLWPTGGLASVVVLGQDCRGTQAGAGFDLPLTVPLLPLADRAGAVPAERARALHCGEHGLHRAAPGLMIGVGTHAETPSAELRGALLDFLLAMHGKV